MVRALVNGAMGYRIDPSRGTHWVGFFPFQPVLHDWCSKDGGMMHIKEPLLLIGKSSLCGGSGFPLSLSEWSFTITIYLTPYNRK